MKKENLKLRKFKRKITTVNGYEKEEEEEESIKNYHKHKILCTGYENEDRKFIIFDTHKL